MDRQQQDMDVPISRFLSSEGELQKLINSYDWSNTSLGPIDLWPQSLRTTVNICLNTKSPVVILWGPDLVRIYNDAYKNLIGNKHPAVLGTKGEEGFPEFWPVIGNFLESVYKKGINGSLENQMLIMNRNGSNEVCYFSFYVSPVYNEHDEVGGVLVNVNETTETVLSGKRVQRLRDKQLASLFMKAPIGFCVLRGTKYIVEIVNNSMLNIWDKPLEEVLNKSIFEGLPEFNSLGYEEFLERVYKTGERHIESELCLKLCRNNKTEELYVKFVYEALKEEDGTVSGIMMLAEEISSQVYSRKKIEESEERLRMAIQSTKLGTWDCNPLSGELTWSPECRAIFSFPQDKKVDFETFTEHIHPEDKEFTLSEINKALEPENGGNYDITYRIIRYDDKSPRWVRSTGKVYFNQQQKPDRFIGTVVDITEQNNMIRELEESERRFRTMADTAPVMIWTSGTNKAFDFFNRGWLSFTGRTLEEEQSKGWIENIHEDDRERCINIYNSYFDLQRKFFLEYRMKRHDGKYRWITNEGTPRYSSDNKFLGYIGTCLDIQERKMAKEELERKVLERTSELNKRNNELKQQKEFVDAILESSVDIIVVLDKELKYVTLNKAACETYRLKKEEVIGKRILEIFPLIKTSGMYNDLEEALTGKTIHNPRYASTVLDKHFENFYIPLKDRNDKVYGVLLISHDNTAIIEAAEKLGNTNRELEEKNLALERSNKELESFSYVASHDLQEPLRKIRTFSGLAQKNMQNERETKKYFKKIDSSAERMSDLIKAVLNYSRLSKRDEHFVKTDLNQILKNVKADYELLIEEKKAIIKSNKLPVITGVPLQLNQLFSNLIGNSIKFSEKKPVIKISARIIEADKMPLHPDIRPGNSYAELIFKDNGIGFEQQYSDQIFTIFKRLHGNQSYSGTGIGLALCKKIVENHRGFIAVQSEPGNGAEFFIYLPVI
jgi:PAS domain S-box-containing protein